MIKQVCKTAEMSVPLATEGPAVLRWCEPFEFKCEGDGAALQPTPQLQAVVPAAQRQIALMC